MGLKMEIMYLMAILIVSSVELFLYRSQSNQKNIQNMFREFLIYVT
jgi:hypothetical protein